LRFVFGDFQARALFDLALELGAFERAPVDFCVVAPGNQ
jgi:hypothetical protein